MFLLSIIGVEDKQGYSEEQEAFLITWVLQSSPKIRAMLVEHLVQLLEES